MNQPQMKFDLTQMETDAEASADFIFNILSRDPDAKIWLEMRVKLPGITDQIWGTADVVIYLPNVDQLWVLDYKYGRVEVHATENEQLLLYLVGAIQTLGIKRLPSKMVIGIIQPRGKDYLDIWEVSSDYLMRQFVPRVKRALVAIDPTFLNRLAFEREFGETSGADLPQPEYVVSDDTCTWCPALAECPAAQAKAMEMCQFIDLAELPEYEKMLPLFPALRKWMDAVEAKAVVHLNEGGEIPGYELGAGRTHRKWTDESAATAFLRGKGLALKAIAPPKLLSPAQMEKVLQSGTKKIAKGELAMYIYQPEGKLKLQKTKTPKPKSE